MKMCYYIFLLFFCFFQGCDFSHNRYVPARYMLIAEQIQSELERTLSEKYNMRVIGTVDGLAGRVNYLGLHFQIQGPLSMERLREITVGCIEAFLVALNENEEIRPYLSSYPFTAKGIDIGIFAIDASGREIFEPDIGVVSAFHGIIQYITIDRSASHEHRTIKTESYDDALAIVHKSSERLSSAKK